MMHQPDLIARDAEDEIALLIDIRAHVDQRRRAEILESLHEFAVGMYAPTTPMVLVTPDTIEVFRVCADGQTTMQTFATRDVLGPYDPDFQRYHRDEHYLESLTFIWLRDLVEKTPNAAAAAILTAEEVDRLDFVALQPRFVG